MLEQRLHDYAIVSIHAPARGATLYGMLTCCIDMSFNPRSRTGSDSSHRHQLTRSCSFNPRSRTGSDHDQTDV